MLSKLHLDITSAFEPITNVEQGHISLVVPLWSGWEVRHSVNKVPHSSREHEEDCFLQISTKCAQARHHRTGITFQVHIAKAAADTAGGLQWKF